jgi:hypothetical protein
MIINSALNISNAFISGWLPGTSGGQGIVDVISGDYIINLSNRKNTLSMDWPKDMVFNDIILGVFKGFSSIWSRWINSKNR